MGLRRRSLERPGPARARARRVCRTGSSAPLPRAARTCPRTAARMRVLRSPCAAPSSGQDLRAHFESGGLESRRAAPLPRAARTSARTRSFGISLGPRSAPLPRAARTSARAIGCGSAHQRAGGAAPSSGQDLRAHEDAVDADQPSFAPLPRAARTSARTPSARKRKERERRRSLERPGPPRAALREMGMVKLLVRRSLERPGPPRALTSAISPARWGKRRSLERPGPPRASAD